MFLYCRRTVVFLAVVLLAVTAAQAAPILVNGYSFEDPVVDPSVGYDLTTPTGWSGTTRASAAHSPSISRKTRAGTLASFPPA